MHSCQHLPFLARKTFIEYFTISNCLNLLIKKAKNFQLIFPGPKILKSLQLCLWTDEDHFCMYGSVNTQNLVYLESSPYPTNGPTFFAGFEWITATSLTGPFFFGKIISQGPKSVSNCNTLLGQVAKRVIPEFQQRGCLATTTFQQDGALPYIGRKEEKFLQCHFTEDHIIRLAFLQDGLHVHLA